MEHGGSMLLSPLSTCRRWKWGFISWCHFAPLLIDDLLFSCRIGAKVERFTKRHKLLFILFTCSFLEPRANYDDVDAAEIMFCLFIFFEMIA